MGKIENLLIAGCVVGAITNSAYLVSRVVEGEKLRKDYLEGVVIDKAYNPRFDSEGDYALRVKTTDGEYSMHISSVIDRPASALMIAIDRGDRIKFSTRHFEDDRIGYCETSQISIVEKVKNSGQVESLENK